MIASLISSSDSHFWNINCNFRNAFFAVTWWWNLCGIIPGCFRLMHTFRIVITWFLRSCFPFFFRTGRASHTLDVEENVALKLQKRDFVRQKPCIEQFLNSVLLWITNFKICFVLAFRLSFGKSTFWNAFKSCWRKLMKWPRSKFMQPPARNRHCVVRRKECWPLKWNCSALMLYKRTNLFVRDLSSQFRWNSSVKMLQNSI